MSKKTSYPEDRLVIERIINKDERALHEFYHTYKSQLFGFIFRRIPQKHIAEEITQDVFLDFLEGLRDFRFQSSLKTYLFTIARNKTIDFIRKKKLKLIFFSHLPSFMVDGLAHFVMDDIVEQKELRREIERTMRRLPRDYQLILRLKYYEERSVQEISVRLAKSFKSTESLLYRARKAFIESYTRLS